jgi:hypothetical protein
MVSSCDGWGLVIDAGSSGSRIHIFTWKKDNTDHQANALHTLREVSKYKITPGISSFEPEEAANSLSPLIAHAQKHVPNYCQTQTNIFLFATAGMRIVFQKQPSTAQAIFSAIRQFLATTPFIVGEEVKNVGIIPGNEEAVFDWLSVNFAIDINTKIVDTVGVIDLGGASTQIAFPVTPQNALEPGVRQVQLQSTHFIYAVSRLHMGVYEAYDNTLKLVRVGESFPCTIPGDFDQCSALVRQFIQKHAAEDMSQLDTTAVAPTIRNFQEGKMMTFYGLDNFAKLSSIVFVLKRHERSRELPPKIFLKPNLNEWVDVGRRICAMGWHELRGTVPRKAAKDKLLGKSCFGLIYSKMLLEDVYLLKSQQLIFAHSIGDIDGSWAMGAAVSRFGNTHVGVEDGVRVAEESEPHLRR